MSLQEEEHPPEATSPPAGPAEALLSSEAMDACADEIRRVGGVEVFFVGIPGAGGRITRVRAEAFGSAETVPAPFNRAKPGEVLIHNHPSGYLEPSDADLGIAARAGMLGVGFYIIDNEASRCRVVVRPHAAAERKDVPEGEVEDIFRPGGRLAQALGSGYESREQQIEMATAAARALNSGGIAVIEAGTGTGKSLAYLVPSVLYALRNDDKVVVSTHTKTLQEQLFEKDIPDLRRMLGVDVRAALLKGRSNYACQRKMGWAAQHQGDFLEPDSISVFERLRATLDESATGDRAHVPFTVPDEVWEEVQSDGDNCDPQRCDYFKECFFYESRRKAAAAHVTVVNHALLLADLYIRQQTGRWSETVLLPPYQHVVIDEAHNLERVAAESLSTRITRRGIQRIVSRLYRKNPRSGSSPLGVIPTFMKVYEAIGSPGLRADLTSVVEAMGMGLRESVEIARDAVEHCFAELPHELLDLTNTTAPRGREDVRIRLTGRMYEGEDWARGPGQLLRQTAEALADLQKQGEELHEDAREVLKEWGNWLGKNGRIANELQSAMGDWGAMLRRLARALQALNGIQREDAAVCRWASVNRPRGRGPSGGGGTQGGRLRVELYSAPLDVSGFLKDILHTRMRTSIYTSATLTVDREFMFFRERTGVPPPGVLEPPPGDGVDGNEPEDPELPPPAPRPVEYQLLESPFRYRERVLFGLPSDLPLDDEGLAFFLSGAIRTSGGRALVLFTSYAKLNRVFALCQRHLAGTAIPLYAQGSEPRTKLLTRFRDEEASALFATASFWEGIDVRGRSLELLAIVKLPFDVPDDPLFEAQCDYLKRCGRDPFRNLSVPRAVIRFKQGFGRLIRSADDFGVVLVTDDRIHTKSYGRRFVYSLPQLPLERAPQAELLGRMRTFYARHRENL